MQHYDNDLIFAKKLDRKCTLSKISIIKGLVVSSKMKMKWYLKSIKNATALNFTNCKHYHTNCKIITSKMESKYYEQEFAKYNHDMRNTGTIMNSLLYGNNGIVYFK